MVGKTLLILAILMTVTHGLVASAGRYGSCREIFGSLFASADQRYSRALGETDRIRRAQAVHMLLRETFAPLVLKLRDVVERLPNDKLEKAIQRRSPQKLHDGQYRAELGGA